MKAICSSFKDALSFNYITGVYSYSFQSEIYIPSVSEILDDTMYVVIDNDSAGNNFGKQLNEIYDLKIIRPILKDVFLDVKNYNLETLKKHYLKQL